MKKIYLLGIAALSLLAVSCGKDNKDNIDWGAVTVNGFYVAGPATGSDEIKADCVMAAGFNEVDKAVREAQQFEAEDKKRRSATAQLSPNSPLPKRRHIPTTLHPCSRAIS